MMLSPFPADIRITDSVVAGRSEPWTSIMHLITAFGDTMTLFLVMLAVFVLAWLGRRPDLSLLILFGSVTGYFLMVLLKLAFGRPRPPIEDRLQDVGTLSMPSGHAMVSVIVYGFAAVILFRTFPLIRRHPWWLLGFPVLVIAIGFSRIYLGVHWMSDVVFGWIFGLLWLALCLFGARWFRLRTRVEPVAASPDPGSPALEFDRG